MADQDNSIVEVFTRWMSENANLIRAAWRAADLRLIRNEPLAAAFATRIRRLNPADLVAFEQFVGIDGQAVQALMDPHGLTWLGWECVERAAKVLGFDARHYLDPPVPGPLTPAQSDALFAFAHAKSLQPLAHKRLRRHAERQQAAGVLRFSLVTLSEWAAFHAQIARVRRATP